MFVGTFYLPIKSFSLPYFNIETSTPPASEPERNTDGIISYKICNPFPGPKLGRPLLFINSKPTEAVDACGHFTFFNPVALVADFLIYLLLVNIIASLARSLRNS